MRLYESLGTCATAGKASVALVMQPIKLSTFNVNKLQMYSPISRFVLEATKLISLWVAGGCFISACTDFSCHKLLSLVKWSEQWRFIIINSTCVARGRHINKFSVSSDAMCRGPQQTWTCLFFFVFYIYCYLQLSNILFYILSNVVGGQFHLN